MKFNENIAVWLNKKKNLYILLGTGIIILISANFLPTKKPEKTETPVVSAIFDSRVEEERLGNILSKVAGAGKTEVMITYENGGEKIALQNSKVNKSTKDGLTDNKTTAEVSEEREAVMNGSGTNRNPFIIKENAPKVRGVLVITEGGDDKNVRYEITNAVAAVLDVPYYRIQVLKKSR